MQAPTPNRSFMISSPAYHPRANPGDYRRHAIMLTHLQRDEAARHLLAARRSRQPGSRLSESCRPADIEDALAIQRRVQQLLGLASGGWKCSLPTAERALSYAAIFEPAIARASPCAVIARGGRARIEPEIAFVLGRDLPPRGSPYTEAELRTAIVETRLVLELLDSRYADPAGLAFPELLADQVSNQGLFVGPVLDDAPSRPLEGFAIAVDGPAGALHRLNGRHPDGHPLRTFLWFANFLATRAEVGGLKAGQIVTTGSYAGGLEVPVPSSLAVRFGELGAIRVDLVAA
jgi:2-keto-4-pentenoate hydratase